VLRLATLPAAVHAQPDLRRQIGMTPRGLALITNCWSCRTAHWMPVVTALGDPQ